MQSDLRRSLQASRCLSLCRARAVARTQPPTAATPVVTRPREPPVEPVVADAKAAEREELSLGDSKAVHVRVTDAFLPAAVAKKARGEYDACFGGTRVRPESFVWQLWHAPAGQYIAQRTPAPDFFTPSTWAAVETCLLDYGRSQLGCASLSPAWLSVYTEGCEQRLHADLPHGPFAFVLSLTKARASFAGGETLILRPSTLDYWRAFDAGAVVELPSLAQTIAPAHNRLVVFDARLPHAVTRVGGVSDPVEARVVIHGWFTEPTPFFEGALREEDATGPLNEGLSAAFEELGTLCPLIGLLALRIEIEHDGRGAATQGMG